MTTTAASLITNPLFIATNTSNQPLAGGKLYTYAAGTLTPLTTYTDSTLTVPNTNPIILDEFGSAQVWLGHYTYKLNLTDVNSVQQANFPIDNLVGSNGFTNTGLFQPAIYTTAQRNALSLVAGNEGGMVYDSTLSKPIWLFNHTGPIWHDAMGNAV